MKKLVALALPLLLSATVAAPLRHALEHWVLTETVRIGSVDNPDDSFVTITGAAIHPRGHVYVAQPQVQEIRVYSHDGRFIQSIGRRGRGPGEFEYPTEVGFLGNVLWVRDSRLRRLSFFGLDGSFQRAVNLPGNFYAAPLGNGDIAVTASASPEAIVAGLVPAIPLMRLDSTGHPVDTLASISTEHRVLALGGPPQDWARHTTQPFAHTPLVAAAPSGDVLYLVERTPAENSDAASFRVLTLSAAGDTIDSRRYRYTPRRLRRATVDAFAEDWAKQAQDFVRARGLSIPLDGVGAEAVKAALYIPRFMPPISDLLVDRNGSLWLRRENDYRSREIRWILVAPDGHVRAVVSAPRQTRLVAVDGRVVWGVQTDDLGVHYLVKFQAGLKRVGHESNNRH